VWLNLSRAALVGAGHEDRLSLVHQLG